MTSRAGMPGGDRAGGKGPVRGFPPRPGQPPPLYPPGQFAAWNRMSGADTAASPDAGAGRAWGAPADAGQAPGGAGAGAWYGGAGDQAYEPGYSALAVNDAAADVTSTQTWQVIGDEPDGAGGAGGWTPSQAAGRNGDTAQLDPARTSDPADAGDTARMAAPAGLDSAPVPPGGRTRAGADGSPGGAAGSPGPGRGPETRPPGSRTASRAAAGGSRGGRSSRPRKRSPSVILAVGAVLVVAAAAALFLLHTAQHQDAAVTPPPAPTKAATSPAPTPSPSPSLGPFGHIASRSTDAIPVTIAQLFPPGFKDGGAAFVRTASKGIKACGRALIGSKLQAAVKSAKCSQVVRATYVSIARKEMGTIGVVNLASSKTAARAGGSAGPANFIAQLRGRKGPSHLLGKGTGIEEAETKGHYLILIWAQFTGRHKPQTKAQRRQLGSFMSEVFQHTANVSLSNRMVDGQP